MEGWHGTLLAVVAAVRSKAEVCISVTPCVVQGTLLLVRPVPIGVARRRHACSIDNAAGVTAVRPLSAPCRCRQGWSWTLTCLESRQVPEGCGDL